jgi:hypothetical protein
VKRVQVRRSVYRGLVGFTVRDARSSVFTETREQADALRDVLTWELPFSQHVWAMQAILLGGAR